jgi:hypothetical protein
MATSTDNRRSREEGSCRHRDTHSESLLKKYGHDCPTDLSFWCANDILADLRKLEFECRTRHESHEKRLWAEFGGILERNLTRSYHCEGVQVIWSLEEKSIEVHDIVRDDLRQRAISKALLELNADYHSHPLLWRLVGFALGRSHVFSVEAHEEGACLVVRPLLCLSPEKGSEEWRIPVPLASGCSVPQLLRELRDLPDQAEPELIGKIKEKVKNQIDVWVPAKWGVWPQQEFEARLRNDDERQDASKNDFQELFRRAARHIALILIYQACNDFGTVSYILAPTLQGQCESSLVICWPRSIREGNLNLLYLLQMILGQNATAILGQQEKRRKSQQLAEARKLALGHLGHTLQHRLDTVQAFLDQHGQAALSGHVLLLRDLAVILQLNTVDDQDELLAIPKRDRFLEYADEESARPLDLMGRIMRDWSELVARKQSYSDAGQRLNAWCRLDMHSSIKDARLTYALTDEDGRRCRVSEAIYRELLFELFLNARRYGYVHYCPDETHEGVPIVSVRCEVDAAEVKGRTLLTLVNQIHPGKELPPHLRSAEWSRWPAEGKLKFDGPGMAVDLLRRLGIGDLFFRSQTFETGDTFFIVGLDLLGLEIA